jgi:uncharacterized protein YyaL (SSP411 family)
MLANLLRLARLTGLAELEERAGRLAETFAADVAGQPSAHTEFLCGLDFALGPSREVVVVGKRGEKATEELLAALRGTYLPNAVVLFKPSAVPGSSDGLKSLPPTGQVGGRAPGYPEMIPVLSRGRPRTRRRSPGSSRPGP